ncbi:hypothetical protein JCM19992_16220 [Thermostilla marina]
MNAIPTAPHEILQAIAARLNEATGIPCYLVANTHMLAKLPPGADQFAAIAIEGITYEGQTQIPGTLLIADLRIALTLYAKTALDRAHTAEKLLTDADRGLWPLSMRALGALAGGFLEAAEGVRLVDNLRVVATEAVGWGESGRHLLAYLTHRLEARALFADR